MFTCYPDGAAFLRDNLSILDEHPIETMFFRGNARQLTDPSLGFAVKASDRSGCLLALRYQNYSTVLFGDVGPVGLLAEGLVKNNLTFSRVLCPSELAAPFFAAYERLAGGSHRLVHDMYLMKCSSAPPQARGGVERAVSSDVGDLARLMSAFNAEALGFQISADELAPLLQTSFHSFYVVRESGVLACVAQRARETDRFCAVTNVFTRPEYRGRGLARRVVSAVTRDIAALGKLAYLYVDSQNPVTNRLYTNLGYTYLSPQSELEYLAQ